MAKDYIVKQTFDYMGRGEKTVTFTVSCENDTQLALIVGNLEGNVKVFEENVNLGVTVASTGTMSVNCVDSIKLRRKGAETKYISAYQKPILFKSSVDLISLAQTMRTMFKPFNDTFVNDLPDDVSIDSGDVRKLGR